MKLSNRVGLGAGIAIVILECAWYGLAYSSPLENASTEAAKITIFWSGIALFIVASAIVAVRSGSEWLREVAVVGCWVCGGSALAAALFSAVHPGVEVPRLTMERIAGLTIYFGICMGCAMLAGSAARVIRAATRRSRNRNAASDPF